MPPRFSYWTIIAGGLPTAFRATEREELMPTFTRLREKHPDAEMKWFARGKLWESPEAVREDTERRRGGFARDGGAAPKREGDRPREGAADTRDRSRHRDRPEGPPRNREWRPGGEHRDPRQKFIDAKKAKNLDRRREKFARKHGDDGAERPAPPRREFERPRGEAAAPPASPKRDVQRSGDGGKRAWDRPREDRPAAPKRDWDKPREGGRPPFDRDRKGPPRSEWRGKPAGSSAPKREWTKPRGEFRARDEGDRPPRRDDARPSFDRDRKAPPRSEWRGKPAGSSAPKREWTKPRGEFRPRDDYRSRDERQDRPAPPKRNWDAPREDRPAAPKRAWDKPGDRGTATPKREWSSPREGGPRRDDTRPPFDRDRKGPPKADWRNKAGGSAPPRRDWDRPRESSAARPKRDWDRPREGGAARPKREWNPSRGFERNQGTEEPPAPPRPRGPNREPRPSESPEPSKPPRPSEPTVPPPGPPERGRLNRNKRRP